MLETMHFDNLMCVLQLLASAETRQAGIPVAVHKYHGSCAFTKPNAVHKHHKPKPNAVHKYHGNCALRERGGFTHRGGSVLWTDSENAGHGVVACRTTCSVCRNSSEYRYWLDIQQSKSLGLARTIYIYAVYTVFTAGIIRNIQRIYTVLANPRNHPHL
jgi:hypothetical protein